MPEESGYSSSEERGKVIVKPRKKNDELLKGIFKENFPDFLRFIYPDANELLDFDKGVEFMDKELHSIIPNRESKRDKREADLLAKLYLKDGTEKWVLLNVEIEGGNEQDFAYRLYQYNYRIRDRYNSSVAAIALFTGSESQKRPAEYREELLGTILSFKYLAIHIFEHTEEALLANKNPFALVVLACQKALLEGKIPDDELGRARLTIAKALLSQGYSHDRIISFMGFLKNFIFIDNERINRVFDQQIEELTGGNVNMSVIEVLKMQERQEGRHEEALEIAREMKRDGIPVDKIVKFTRLSLEEVDSL
jgi:pentatricopeptide repeat protein